MLEYLDYDPNQVCVYVFNYAGKYITMFHESVKVSPLASTADLKRAQRQLREKLKLTSYYTGGNMLFVPDAPGGPTALTNQDRPNAI